MLDKKNLMDDGALSAVNGGADNNKGVDGGAAHTIKIPCMSPQCKGTPRIFDCYSGGRAVCRSCGNEIFI